MVTFWIQRWGNQIEKNETGLFKYSYQ